MNTWLQSFLIPIASGVVAVVAVIIFRGGDIGESEVASHRRQFNVHAWYAVGILGFLLICSLAINWGSIKDLSTILSFAVGLASLILALIAIIQSLTSTNNVEASLAAVREVAIDAAKSGSDLAVSISAIREAATLAESASSSALKATEELSALGTRVIRSSDEGRAAIDELRNEIKAQANSNSAKEPNATPAGEKHIFVNNITLGGSTASYAAIRAFQHKKEFSWEDIFGEDETGFFENGYLSALDDLGLISIRRSENKAINILKVSDALLKSLDYIANKPFGKPNLDKQIKSNMAKIDSFMSSGSTE